MASVDGPDPAENAPDPGGSRHAIVRAVAQVRHPYHGVIYRGRDAGREPGRAAASVPRNREQTHRLQPPRPQQPVFVDDTGHRGRRLAWVAAVAALIGLLLIAAFWISQVTSVGP
jgi:hypothetical protein